MKLQTFLVNMARRISGRVGQCCLVVIAACLFVTVIGSAIAVQSYGRIEAKQAVMKEMGFTPWVPASHFMDRTVREDLAAGLFFGITIGIPAGIGLFLLCLLCESLPTRPVRVGVLVLFLAVAGWLSCAVFRVEAPGAIVLASLFPVTVGAIAQLLSSTPVWRESGVDDSGEPDETRAWNKRYTYALIALNVIAAFGLMFWAYRTMTVLRMSTRHTDFFVSYRDNFLMQSRPGQAVDRYYYHNTSYASEYFPPTHFQPVCVVAAGVSKVDAGLIPSVYGGQRIPVYTLCVGGIEDAATRFSEGAFDLLVVDTAALDMTEAQVEDALASRGNLPANWRLRTILFSGGEKTGTLVQVPKVRMNVSRAIRQALGDAEATGPASAIRQVIKHGFLSPLQTMLGRASMLLAFLVLVVWISCVVTACASSRGGVRATWMAVSVVAVVFSCRLAFLSPPRRDLVTALTALDGKKAATKDVAVMLESSSASDRYVALRHLVKRPHPALAGKALELFDDPNECVRMTAVEFLSKLPRAWFLKNQKLHDIRQPFVKKVMAALDDESLHVRCRATEVIANQRFRECENALLEMVKENRDLYVTWRAIQALYKLNPVRKGPT